MGTRASFCGVIALVVLCAASDAAAQEQERRIRYFNQEWSFDDVDVATLSRRLGQIGLELPVTLTGKISGTLNVGVPWGALGDARAWRLGGSLTSAELSINGFVLRGVVVRLQYRDGALYLDELRVQVPEPAAQQAGILTGTAQMELVPRGQFTANVRADALPLATLLQRIATLQPVAGGLSGNLTAAADVNRLQDLGAWTISGPVSLRGLTVRNLPPAEATTQLALKGAVLTAQRFRLTVGSASIDADGQLNLLADRRWTVDATLQSPELASLVNLLSDALGDDSLGQSAQQLAVGAVQVTSQLSGTLTPMSAQAAGRLELSNIQLRPPADLTARVPLKPLQIERLALDYQATSDSIRATQITATLAGGQATGSATIPLGQGNVEATLEWRGLRIADLLAEPFGGSGVSNGRLQLIVPGGAWGDVARWQLNANAELTEAAYGPWTLGRVQSGDVTVSEGRLRVPQFSALVDGEPIVASLDLMLAAPWSINATFDVARLPIAWLEAVPQFAGLARRTSGIVGVSGRVTGAWSPQTSLQGTAQIRGRDLRFDSYAVDALQAELAIGPEQVVVENLRAELYGGEVDGAATITLGENIGAAASLTWRGIDATAIGRGLTGSPVTPVGVSHGSLTLTIPAGSLDDRAQWSGAAEVHLDQLNIYDLPFLGVDAEDVQLAQGRVQAPRVTAQLDGRLVEASASLALAAPWALEATLRLPQIRVAHLGTLLQVEFLRERGDGGVDFVADIRATLSPFNLSATGTVAGADVGLYDHPIDRISFAFAYNSQALAMSKLNASLYDGRVTGDVVFPLVDEAAGSAAVQWAGLDVGRSLGTAVDLPFELQGRSDGSARLAIPAGRFDELAFWDIDAHVSLPNLEANGVVVAAIDAQVRQQAQSLSYSASGRLLGGVLSAAGRREPSAATSGPAALGDVRLTLRGANIATAVSVGLDRQERPGPVEGTFDVNFISNSDREGWGWRADLALSQVRAEGVELTPGLRLRVAGNDGSLRLQQLSGEFAGGRLSASGAWDIANRRAPVFRVGLRSAHLERVSHLLTDSDELPLTGPLDVDLRVRPGAVWRIAGIIGTGQGNFYDVRFSNVSVPVDIEWHPPSGRMRIQVPSMHLSLAGGQVTGRLMAQRTTGWMLDAAFKFYRVDVVTLIRQLGSDSQYGKGRLTGTLTLTGRNMQSLNDLRGVLQADLEDAQAGSLPVIGNLGSYVPGAGASGATQFGEGRLEARLMRGVVHLGRLTLASNQLDIFMSGLINLNGRLRLEAVVYTGRQNPFIAEALLTRITAVAAPPVALLATASDFLSNRVIYLDIGGTLSRPVIRVRPLDILREEIVRYLLQRAAGAVVGVSAPVPAVTADPGR